MSGIVTAILQPNDLPRAIVRYGQALIISGEYNLALVVFATATEMAAAIGDFVALAISEERRGSCLRQLCDFDAAHTAYLNAVMMAAAKNDDVTEFRARIGHAEIAVARGNFPAAERALDLVIEEASALEGCGEVLGRAYHTRGIVAHGRKQYELALSMYADALRQLHCDLAMFYRVKIDMGRALREIPRATALEAAWGAFQSVRDESPEPFLRAAARINLIALAAQLGDRRQFDRISRELDGEELPPRLRTAYMYEFGSGEALFGNREVGRRMMTEALAMARKWGLHDMEFDAESELLRPPAEVETADSRESAVQNAVLALKMERVS